MSYKEVSWAVLSIAMSRNSLSFSYALSPLSMFSECSGLH